MGVTASPAATAPHGNRESIKLRDPLVYGKDFVEVTESGTLRRRYRVRGDFDQELQSYVQEGNANTQLRGTPPRILKMGCVFLKDARITCGGIQGSDGQPLTAVYTTPLSFVETMRKSATQRYRDFMFAFSGGELDVQWTFETVSGLEWKCADTQHPAWGCQPRAVAPQIEKALDKHKGAGVEMWVFCAGQPTTQNAANRQQKIGSPPYGISYTAWLLHGGYSLVICAPDLGLIVHEFSHRYLDNLTSIEGIRLTMFHGLANLGYEDDDLGYPPLHNTYRSVYQYLIRRDMWRRFTITGHNQIAQERFSAKPYRWDAVKDDCWFKLPLLGNAELAQLTGLASFQMDAQAKTTYRLYKVAEKDRNKVLSPYVDQPDEKDVQLNNLIALHTESAAVLRTATGHWLFVRPDLADVYVDMFQISGKASGPLPVHGYVLEGIRPLLVLKAPAELPVPKTERGYFEH
jgi:hypothetical protein